MRNTETSQVKVSTRIVPIRRVLGQLKWVPTVGGTGVGFRSRVWSRFRQSVNRNPSGESSETRGSRPNLVSVLKTPTSTFKDWCDPDPHQDNPPYDSSLGTPSTATYVFRVHPSHRPTRCPSTRTLVWEDSYTSPTFTLALKNPLHSVGNSDTIGGFSLNWKPRNVPRSTTVFHHCFLTRSHRTPF